MRGPRERARGREGGREGGEEKSFRGNWTAPAVSLLRETSPGPLRLSHCAAADAAAHETIRKWERRRRRRRCRPLHFYLIRVPPPAAAAASFVVPLNSICRLFFPLSLYSSYAGKVTFYIQFHVGIQLEKTKCSNCFHWRHDFLHSQLGIGNKELSVSCPEFAYTGEKRHGSLGFSHLFSL